MTRDLLIKDTYFPEVLMQTKNSFHRLLEEKKKIIISTAHAVFLWQYAHSVFQLSSQGYSKYLILALQNNTPDLTLL